MNEDTNFMRDNHRLTHFFVCVEEEMGVNNPSALWAPPLNEGRSCGQWGS